MVLRSSSRPGKPIQSDRHLSQGDIDRLNRRVLIDMLKKFSILFAAGLVVTLPSAFAATNLQISLQETGYSDTTSSSPSGAVSINNMNYGDFQINTVSGIGSPVFGAP